MIIFRIIIFLSLIFLTSSITADTKCEKRSKKSCYRGQVEKLPAKRIFSVVDNCREPVPWFEIKDKYYELFLNDERNKNKNKKRIITIAGLELIATLNEEIYLKNLIATKDRNGRYIISRKIVEKMAHAPCGHHPKSAICALSALYGERGDRHQSEKEEAAMRAMLMAAEYGYYLTPRLYYNPNNDLAASETPEWGLNSIRQINNILDKLPEKFHHLPSLKYIYKTMDSDQHLVSEKTLAWYIDSSRNEIIYKQRAFENQKRDISCTIAHELTHAFYQENEKRVLRLPIWSKGFRGDYSRWEIEPLYDISRLSNYSTKNYKEYFSEAVAYYLCSGDKLKRVAPKLYGILKRNIFDNREYLKKPSVAEEDLYRNIRLTRGDLSSFLPIKQKAKKVLADCLSDGNAKINYRFANNKIYFYKKEKSTLALVGRTINHPYFRECFMNQAKKYATKIINSYKECNPPLKKDIINSIVNESFKQFANFEEKLLAQQ
ncbi:MAG: hypothetical protein HQK49_16090 [Oligoflexia bacterium]|nr:hypothetical protein [Oligoflexia bacterium]